MNNELRAIKAALLGGRAILEVYHREDTIKVLEKEDKSPLTEADTAAHSAIMSLLEETSIPVLSEEGKELDVSERQSWEQLWIVDPLDGTKEFIKRNGEFTVNIALAKNGVPLFGVVYVPVQHTLYFGGEGIGAFKIERIDFNTEISSLEELISASVALPIEIERPFTIVGSRSHMNEDTEKYVSSLKEKHGEIEIMSVGSSLKICMVVEGKADEYPRFAPTMEWDTAAGHALVRAVNKEMIIPGEGVSLRYNKENLLNPYFLVRSRAN